jgi:hypothetical protein
VRSDKAASIVPDRGGRPGAQPDCGVRSRQLSRCHDGGWSAHLQARCPETESNRRHEDFQSSALPTELSGLGASASRGSARGGLLSQATRMMQALESNFSI